MSIHVLICMPVHMSTHICPPQVSGASSPLLQPAVQSSRPTFRLYPGNISVIYPGNISGIYPGNILVVAGGVSVIPRHQFGCCPGHTSVIPRQHLGFTQVTFRSLQARVWLHPGNILGYYRRYFGYYRQHFGYYPGRRAPEPRRSPAPPRRQP